MLEKVTHKLRTLAALSAVIAGMGFVVLTPQASIAAPVDVLQTCTDADGDGITDEASESKVCQGTNKNSLNGLIVNVVNLLIMITGVIAVIMIVIGGIRYTTSAGDAGQTKTARDTIIYAIAGLVVAIMAYAIVNLVLSKL